jgi:hypothetical protein
MLTNTTAPLNDLSSNNRPLFRFGHQTDQQQQANILLTNNNNLNNHLNSRTSVKQRSAGGVGVNQVADTAIRRQPVQTNGGHDTTTTNGGGEFQSSFEPSSNKILDYQAAYEMMRKENEQLRLAMASMQKENDETNKVKIDFALFGINLFVMSCFDLKKNQLLDSSLDKRVLTNFV